MSFSAKTIPPLQLFSAKFPRSTALVLHFPTGLASRQTLVDSGGRESECGYAGAARCDMGAGPEPRGYDAKDENRLKVRKEGGQARGEGRLTRLGERFRVLGRCADAHGRTKKCRFVQL